MSQSSKHCLCMPLLKSAIIGEMSVPATDIMQRGKYKKKKEKKTMISRIQERGDIDCRKEGLFESKCG